MTLHVFHDGEADWYVAESADEAATLQRSMSLVSVEDQDWTFEALPDDKPLTITGDPYDEPAVKETKTCAEWAASNGKGFLCSTEY